MDEAHQQRLLVEQEDRRHQRQQQVVAGRVDQTEVEQVDLTEVAPHRLAVLVDRTEVEQADRRLRQQQLVVGQVDLMADQ